MKNKKVAIDEAEARRTIRIETVQRGIPTFFDKVAATVFEATDDSSDAEITDEHQQLLELIVHLESTTRFMPLVDRLEAIAKLGSSVQIPPIFETMFQGTTTPLQWRGLPLIKSVFDFALYPQLIQEIQPASIIEIGSGLGASAIWMRDTATSLNLTPRIVSVDISQVEVEISGVEFLRGDANHIDQVLTPEILKSLPHPWLVVEDAHVNVNGILEYLRDHFSTGDYLFIEDNSPEKSTSIEPFFFENRVQFQVDSRFLDKFGVNATSAKNSIFRVMTDCS